MEILGRLPNHRARLGHRDRAGGRAPSAAAVAGRPGARRATALPVVVEGGGPQCVRARPGRPGGQVRRVRRRHPARGDHAQRADLGRLLRRGRLRQPRLGGPGPEPIGAHGLVRFDENLELAWEYPDDTPYDTISDCYALNVADEDVWACYYTDFPVVRVAAGRVTGWPTEGRGQGPHAVVTDGYRCALVGSSGDGSVVVVSELSHDGRFTAVREPRGRGPTGPWP